VLPFEEASLVAVHLDSLLPATGNVEWWVARGKVGLPGGIGLPTSWAILARTYGLAFGSTEMDQVEIWFCARPLFRFSVEADPAQVGSLEVTNDLSRVPPEASVIEVFVDPSMRGPPDWSGCPEVQRLRQP
jgi:hypothetical protein